MQRVCSRAPAQGIDLRPIGGARLLRNREHVGCVSNDRAREQEPYAGPTTSLTDSELILHELSESFAFGCAARAKLVGEKPVGLDRNRRQVDPAAYRTRDRPPALGRQQLDVVLFHLFRFVQSVLERCRVALGLPYVKDNQNRTGKLQDERQGMKHIDRDPHGRKGIGGFRQCLAMITLPPRRGLGGERCRRHVTASATFRHFRQVSLTEAAAGSERSRAGDLQLDCCPPKVDLGRRSPPSGGPAPSVGSSQRSPAGPLPCSGRCRYATDMHAVCIWPVVSTSPADTSQLERRSRRIPHSRRHPPARRPKPRRSCPQALSGGVSHRSSPGGAIGR